ncbi:hypothetical protein HK405_012816, partial [Cladochytrium tenue]
MQASTTTTPPPASSTVADAPARKVRRQLDFSLDRLLGSADDVCNSIPSDVGCGPASPASSGAASAPASAPSSPDCENAASLHHKLPASVVAAASRPPHLLPLSIATPRPSPGIAAPIFSASAVASRTRQTSSSFAFLTSSSSATASSSALGPATVYHAPAFKFHYPPQYVPAPAAQTTYQPATQPQPQPPQQQVYHYLVSPVSAAGQPPSPPMLASAGMTVAVFRRPSFGDSAATAPHTLPSPPLPPEAAPERSTWLAAGCLPPAATTSAAASNQPASSPTPDSSAVGAAPAPGGKAFACQFPGCTRVFTRRQNMDCHMTTHTGARPYVCNIADCQTRFRRRQDLYRHERSVHRKLYSGPRDWS